MLSVHFMQIWLVEKPEMILVFSKIQRCDTAFGEAVGETDDDIQTKWEQLRSGYWPFTGDRHQSTIPIALFHTAVIQDMHLKEYGQQYE